MFKKRPDAVIRKLPDELQFGSFIMIILQWMEGQSGNFARQIDSQFWLSCFLIETFLTQSLTGNFYFIIFRHS